MCGPFIVIRSPYCYRLFPSSHCTDYKKGSWFGEYFEIHQNVYLIASSYYSSRLNEGLGEGQSKVEEWLVVL
jgi:hypothetical protein